MAYNEELAVRVRAVLSAREGVREQKMFGGLAFMLNGNMCCGVEKENLMVRVGPELHGEALRRPHARPMDFTGKPLNGFVYVDPAGIATDKSLRQWVDMGVSFAGSLPPK